jgi:hypothetical protein
MAVHLDKEKKCGTASMTAIYTPVTEFTTTRTETVRHILYMGNFFPSSELFDGFHTNTISNCGSQIK